MGNGSSEAMLAQEQAVICRGPGVLKGVEAAFGLGGETEGTLVLTERRLVYVHGKEKEEGLRIGALSAKRLYFSDVEDLNSLPLDSESFEMPLAKITKIVGHRGEATVAPRLVVSWTEENGQTRSTEFVQQITGGSRRKNVSDWAGVVERLQANRLKVVRLPAPPAESTLEGKILGILGDMQDKGPMAIEEEVEERYKLDLDPDEVQRACDRLVASGLVQKASPKGEDSYYRKASPLGDDDLSA
jgi:hypothetical protein